MAAKQSQQIREVKVKRNFTRKTPGSVLYRCGETLVLCTASIETSLPPWMKAEDGRGWVTAEYNMLPGSTSPRKRRDRNKVDGRTTEIQRLIGRSLRAIVDMERLGPRMITVDCDVLEADGGTRTASITGAFIALFDAIYSIRKELPQPGRLPFRDSVAAISVGIVDGKPRLDLDYELDFAADVDMNLVMTGNGDFVEIQGTGEEATFSQSQLDALLKLGREGIRQLTEIQKSAIGKRWQLMD